MTVFRVWPYKSWTHFQIALRLREIEDLPTRDRRVEIEQRALLHELERRKRPKLEVVG